MKNNPPKEIEPFELFSKFENPKEWVEKSLFENIVNGTTNAAFFKTGQNTKRSKKYFARRNYSNVQTSVHFGLKSMR